MEVQVVLPSNGDFICARCGKTIKEITHICHDQKSYTAVNSPTVTSIPLTQQEQTPKQKLEVIRGFLNNISKQQSLPPDIQKIINDNFWDMI